MEMTYVDLWGVKIQEPVTTFTDLIVSAVCFYGFYKLHKSGNKEKTIMYFKYYLLTMGVATTLGGVLGHAFIYALDFAWKLPGWVTSMISIMLIERASIEHTKILLKPKLVRAFKIVNLIEFFIFLGLTFYTLNFFYVEFHSGYGLMFVVLSLQSYIYYKKRNEGSRTILIGLAFAAIAALFFMTETGFHKWFNHIDISHTLMAVSAYFFYKGATKLEFYHE